MVASLCALLSVGRARTIANKLAGCFKFHSIYSGYLALRAICIFDDTSLIFFFFFLMGYSDSLHRVSFLLNNSLLGKEFNDSAMRSSKPTNTSTKAWNFYNRSGKVYSTIVVNLNLKFLSVIGIVLATQMKVYPSSVLCADKTWQNFELLCHLTRDADQNQRRWRCRRWSCIADCPIFILFQYFDFTHIRELYPPKHGYQLEGVVNGIATACNNKKVVIFGIGSVDMIEMIFWIYIAEIPSLDGMQHYLLISTPPRLDIFFVVHTLILWCRHTTASRPVTGCCQAGMSKEPRKVRLRPACSRWLPARYTFAVQRARRNRLRAVPKYTVMHFCCRRADSVDQANSW